MTLDQAIAFAHAELERAKACHPDFNSGHEGYAVIREELDELWDEVKRTKHYRAYDDAVAYESVQVAAMALRFLVDLCDADGLRVYRAARIAAVRA